ncbi:diguanylate cyclase domain-containing protein [Rhodanobacter sp. BL-MT-08]
MLGLAMVAAACATAIHWLSHVRQPLDLIIPPTMFVVFGALLITLIRQPRWVLAIGRCALLVSGVALVAPTWVYVAQAFLTPGLQLITILPPISSLLLILVLMVMLFFPTPQSFRIALLAWALVALPVIVYLLLHPLEMATPRGRDLLMAYGPALVLVAVLIPVQRGLAGKIERLTSERARLEIIANHDPLTHIANRRPGEQILQGLLVEGIPAGVIMFDMDRFKAINDTYGHAVGDQVLQTVAQHCDGLLRRGECVSRWGGEEFLVVVPHVDAAGLRQLAERLRSAIAALVVAPATQVTASFGIAMIEAGDNLTSVLQRADRALYEAKRQGGNGVIGQPPESMGITSG